MPDEEILTLDEVARTLRVSVATVRRLIHEKALKAIKVRGQLRVRREDLDAYLRQE